MNLDYLLHEIMHEVRLGNEGVAVKGAAPTVGWHSQ